MQRERANVMSNTTGHGESILSPFLVQCWNLVEGVAEAYLDIQRRLVSFISFLIQGPIVLGNVEHRLGALAVFQPFEVTQSR